ncbi:hypothetical protein [Synechococcus sp. A15-44]|jgi:hypothetical protein|uniref:hypothetical protein n=1 Tax=Synechococcus sp. A15-44 TaxID=1050646 RepID=UPI00185FC3A5|nr:hypothetical protein SynA1544_02627 [Synechococcus sp. A15-44]
MRTYLAKEGHNHKDINKLKLFTCKKSPKANTVIVSYRDPASRITSSFVNKFHIYENRTIFDGKKKFKPSQKNPQTRSHQASTETMERAESTATFHFET